MGAPTVGRLGVGVDNREARAWHIGQLNALRRSVGCAVPCEANDGPSCHR